MSQLLKRIVPMLALAGLLSMGGIAHAQYGFYNGGLYDYGPGLYDSYYNFYDGGLYDYDPGYYGYGYPGYGYGGYGYGYPYGYTGIGYSPYTYGYNPGGFGYGNYYTNDWWDDYGAFNTWYDYY